MLKELWQRIRLGLALTAVGLAGGYWALIRWVDWLWFQSLGFEQVFVKVLLCRALFVVAGLVVGLVVLPGSFQLSRRIDRRPSWAEERPGDVTGGPVLWALLPALLSLAALVFASSVSQLWSSWLLLTNVVPAGVTEPVFGRDVSFYFAVLPFWANLQKLLFGLLLTTWLALYCRYIELPVPGDPDSFGDLRAVSPAARAHLSGFGAVLLVVWAWGLWLTRFNLLVTSRSNVVHGVGYTDAHLRLPLLTIELVVALVAAVVLLSNIRARSLGRLAWTAASFGGLYLLGLAIAPVYQHLVVGPNEVERERPYIARSITATRAGLGLDRAEVRQYAPGVALGSAALAEEQETLATVPLWSANEVTEQIVGTETLRGYYNFLMADYDRYRLAGRSQQVAIVAREMQTDRLDARAQNWVNRHLVFTHGLGVVMASAHAANAEGSPVKLIGDLPPRTPPELPLAQPRIYYGEFPAEYAITGLRPGVTVQELDYPSGENNVSFTYDGRGGVPLGGRLRRLAFALRLGSLNVLISDLPQPGSRVHFNRSVYDRLGTIAPFLDYDSEPYPVVANGRLTWIIDAYTVSQRYPYSQPYPLAPVLSLSQEEQPERETRHMAGYVRNSVKVTIDAYDGTVKFHVFDAQDPLLRTYERAFPTLFTHDPLPGDVAAHVRYPADLFTLQARAYARYHMQSPDVFYNTEDLWDVAREAATVREPQADGTYKFTATRERIPPYYVLLRLPGEQEARFRLILPFTPASSAEAPTGRDNMIGWMAADCDPATYGRLTVFHFPKNSLVYGPMQVEALIDQDPDISQQLTLWSEQGSRVLRGRLLVVPVGDSLLYVEPIFITAERRGALPEMKRVAVLYNGRVRMAPTLDEALALALSGEQERGGLAETLRLRDLARRASTALTGADTARRQGDLKGYGDSLDQTRRALDEMTGGKTK